MKRTLLLITAVIAFAGSISQCQAQNLYLTNNASSPHDTDIDLNGVQVAYLATGTTAVIDLTSYIGTEPVVLSNVDSGGTFNITDASNNWSFTYGSDLSQTLVNFGPPAPGTGSLFVFLTGFALGSTWAGTGWIFRLVRRTAHQNPEI